MSIGHNTKGGSNGHFNHVDPTKANVSFLFLLCVLLLFEFFWCKKCWLVSLEGWEAYLKGLEVFRVQKQLTWVFWIFKGLVVRIDCWRVCLNHSRYFELKKVLFECLECRKDYVSALNMIWDKYKFGLGNWRAQRAHLRENAFIWVKQNLTWMI